MLLNIGKLDLRYYSISELNLGTLLYEIWNHNSEGIVTPFKVEFPDNFSEVPEEYREIEILELTREYGVEEGDQTVRFVFKTPMVDYFEFIIKLSSWDGPFYEGPTPVYPKQTTIYVKKEDY